MRRITLFICSLIFLIPPQQSNGQTRKVGINLAGINDYSEEFIFKDVFKASRQWIPFNSDGSGGWNSGVNVPLRSDGYPLEIPYDNGIDPPQSVRSLILWDLIPTSFMPIGTYTLNISGTGQVRLGFGASGTFTAPGTYTFTPAAGNITVEIIQSDINDPVHNIEIILPGFAADYQIEPFHPDYLDFIANFSVLRFMDLMRTNGSPIQTWSDRTPQNYYTQTLSSGLAYEHIIDLCNSTMKDPWICIPHMADDNFIIQLAQLFHTNLNPNLNIYLEYSNEVWNGTFSQNGYAAAQGNALGYSGQPWEQAWKYTAKRSADVFYLFEQIFGTNSPRLVKLIPSQSANSWVTNYIVSRFEEPLYNPNGVTANAITIAPYFGHGIADDIGNNGLINTITVDEILDLLEASMQSDAYDAIAANLVVANDHGLDLNTYEGGQHLVAYAHQNDATLTQKLNDANRHPRMEDIYCDYLDYWYNTVGADGLFVNFSSQGSYSKYGSWGIKEYQGQPSMDAPKYRAFENCVFGVLPLNLLSFQAKPEGKKSVLLNWLTEMEQNTAIFEIQRSPDNQKFETIGTIDAEGDESLAEYGFFDEQPLNGKNYYRLKIVDFDGSFSYSGVEVVTFEFEESQSPELIPNPVGLEAEIRYNGTNDITRLNIYDTIGKLCRSIEHPGTNVSFSNLEKGMYIIEFIMGNKSIYQKIVKR